ncbi:MAG TPA: hypothetical protein VNR37_09445 [Microbacteriaceae bacterium]|nr:hypothetical protein [Microbacteriaceae bacterium]
MPPEPSRPTSRRTESPSDPGATLRRLVAAVPSDPREYGAWWGGASGRALAARIEAEVAAPVARGVRARTGRFVDPGVVLGLVVESFAPPSQLVRAVRSPSTQDPGAYLGRSLVNALSREIGTESEVELDAVSRRPAPRRRIAPVELATAVGAVHRALRPGTPARLHGSLARVLERVVDRAQDGSLSRLHTRTALDEGLLGLGWSREQLRALVNVVIGARPDHARASLLVGFLIHEEWLPRASPVHRAALDAYARRMARAEAATAGIRLAG